MSSATYLRQVTEELHGRYDYQPEFLQAADEVIESVGPALEAHPEVVSERVLDRLLEPERIIGFRVAWQNDRHQVEVNRGFRVQFNSALGPYKGGLRFHPSVNLSVLKFLGFEQIFKNALTGLSLGGGKGGSDFNPKGRSDGEVMRFCQSFMNELFRHIGASTDVPAGDIGVGGREIGYLFGQYKRLRNEFSGAITGKAPLWGGSEMREEATGYGLVYFVAEMLAANGETLAGKTCLLSGAGNVAQYAAEQLIAQHAKVLTMSDSSGFIHDPDGINADKLEWIMDLKNVRRGRISDYVEKFNGASYTAVNGRKNPLWSIEADGALPCATENEIDGPMAQRLVKGGLRFLAEGANMPLNHEAVSCLREHHVLYGPAKAANAGGVATSGLEMAQNGQRMPWPREQVDAELRRIMRDIHAICARTAAEYGSPGDYALGANVAAFLKVGRAMLDQGLV